MFREVSTVEVKEVLRQRQQGRFLRGIARGVGLDRKTVRRYLEVAVAAGFDPRGDEVGDEIVNAVLAQLRPGRPVGVGRGETWFELEGQYAFLKEKVDAGLKLTKIRTLLRRRGVEVPYRTLYRYCAGAFPDQIGGQRETVRVADGEPGHELLWGTPHSNSYAALGNMRRRQPTAPAHQGPAPHNHRLSRKARMRSVGR